MRRSPGRASRWPGRRWRRTRSSRGGMRAVPAARRLGRDPIGSSPPPPASPRRASEPLRAGSKPSSPPTARSERAGKALFIGGGQAARRFERCMRRTLHDRRGGSTASAERRARRRRRRGSACVYVALVAADGRAGRRSGRSRAAGIWSITGRGLTLYHMPPGDPLAALYQVRLTLIPNLAVDLVYLALSPVLSAESVIRARLDRRLRAARLGRVAAQQGAQRRAAADRPARAGALLQPRHHARPGQFRPRHGPGDSRRRRGG